MRDTKYALLLLFSLLFSTTARDVPTITLSAASNISNENSTATYNPKRLRTPWLWRNGKPPLSGAFSYDQDKTLPILRELNESMADTSALLRQFSDLTTNITYRNTRVSSFYDWNQDGVQDIVMLEVGFFQHGLAELEDNLNGPLITIFCLNKEDFTYTKCFEQRLSLTSALISAPTTNFQVFVHSLVVSDFLRKNEPSFLLVYRGFNSGSTPNEMSFNLSPNEYGWTHFIKGNDSLYEPRWSTAASEGSTISPLVADLDLDGFVDLIGNEIREERRFVWLNDREGGFIRRQWTSLSEVFDLENYSSQPKFDFSHESFSEANKTAYIADFPSSLKTVHLGGIQNNNTVSSLETHHSSVLHSASNIWNKILSKLGFKNSQSDHSPLHRQEEKFLSHHDKDSLPFAMPRNFHWSPRPLPLIEGTPIAPISGHSVVDMNGDCAADLAFVVESPDFEGRYELEIWLLEEDDTGGKRMIWRMWKGQRILLPEGTIAIALNDFSNRGNTDLAVLACDVNDGVDEDSVLDDEAKLWSSMTQIVEQNGTSSSTKAQSSNAAAAGQYFLSDNTTSIRSVCQGLERIVLYKMFQPPLCISEKLMPTPNSPDPNCRQTNDLCIAAPFGFGGIDDGMKRVGISISGINFDHTLKSDYTIGAALPFGSPLMMVHDVDKDGFLDLILLTANRSGANPGEFRIFRNVGGGSSTDNYETEDLLSNVSGLNHEHRPYKESFTSFASFWSFVKTSTEYFANSVISACQTVYRKLLGSKLPTENLLIARHFRAISTVKAPNSSLYAGGFIEDPLTMGTVSFIAFSDNSLNESRVHLYSPNAGSMFARSPMGAMAEENFFISVTVLSEVDNSCLTNGPDSDVTEPILGGVTALTFTDNEGIKYPLRRTRSQISTKLNLISRSNIFGLGRSSNYIEGIQVGLPVTKRTPPTCIKNPTLRLDDNDHYPMKSFHRRWVALIPNSDISVSPASPRWNSRNWNLLLCVNPGQQAFRIIIGTAVALIVVGSMNFILSQREEGSLRRGQKGLRRRLIGP